jgi:hypothetical protein
MLKIEEIPQHEITSETESNLEFLAEHIAHAVVQAAEHAGYPAAADLTLKADRSMVINQER